MTGDEDTSIAAIELCRRVNLSAAGQYEARGVSREDVAIAALYSAFDVASELTGSRIGAVEWLRTGVDLMERQLLEEGGGSHDCPGTA
jgi:hypothetical protein